MSRGGTPIARRGAGPVAGDRRPAPAALVAPHMAPRARGALAPSPDSAPDVRTDVTAPVAGGATAADRVSPRATRHGRWPAMPSAPRCDDAGHAVPRPRPDGLRAAPMRGLGGRARRRRPPGPGSVPEDAP